MERPDQYNFASPESGYKIIPKLYMRILTCSYKKVRSYLRKVAIGGPHASLGATVDWLPQTPSCSLLIFNPVLYITVLLFSI